MGEFNDVANYIIGLANNEIDSFDKTKRFSTENLEYSTDELKDSNHMEIYKKSLREFIKEYSSDIKSREGNKNKKLKRGGKKRRNKKKSKKRKSKRRKSRKRRTRKRRTRK